MLYQILPRDNYQFSAESFNMLLKTLSNYKKGFLEQLLNSDYDYRYIIDNSKDDRISFFIETKNNAYSSNVYNSLITMFADKADVFEINEALLTHRIFTTLYTDDESEYNENQKENKTIATYINDQIFFFILGVLKPNTRLVFDFNVSRNVVKQKGFMRSSSEVKIEGVLRLSAITKYYANDLKNISNAISNLTASEKRLHVLYKNKFKPSNFIGAEVYNFMQFPTLYDKKPNDLIGKINKLYIGQRTLKDNEFNAGACVGCLYHPTSHRKVYIDYIQLRKHGFITGQTGAGKSSAIEEIIEQIITDKLDGKTDIPGFTFFDPAETSALGVLDMIDKKRADGYDVSSLMKHVHYINLGNDKTIFPISLLNQEWDITQTLDFFKSLYGDASTIQVDRMMSSAITCLLMDNQPHSIADVPRLFDDEEFRDGLRLKLNSNPYAQDQIPFLKGKFNSTMVAPILNRTDPFLNTPLKKLMFSIKGSNDGLSNVKKWMDDGDIILFNLAGVSDFDIKVIVGYISTNYYRTCLGRNDGDLLHLLIVDESHKVQIPIYEKIIAEGRKKGLAVLLLTQYLDQYNDSFLASILGNIATKITFRQGADAARMLVANTPNFAMDRNALLSLPDRIGFVSTSDSSEMKTIMVDVKPPYRYTEGKLVNYENTEAVTRNMNKNRMIAEELSRRDFMSKNEAEKLIFKKSMKEEAIEYEHDLIKEGDQVWD
ncbi:MAG: type IV secretory system conjugative DNA transfer family protein [Erysipelotrichaceae bacterium]